MDGMGFLQKHSSQRCHKVPRFGKNNMQWSSDQLTLVTSVDGRNPAPPGMFKTIVNDGINCSSTGAGFLPSTVAVYRGWTPTQLHWEFK